MARGIGKRRLASGVRRRLTAGRPETAPHRTRIGVGTARRPTIAAAPNEPDFERFPRREATWSRPVS